MSKLSTDRRLYIAPGVLSVVLALALVACDDHAGSPSTPPRFVSSDITGVRWGRDFHLIDHTAGVRSKLGENGRRVQGLFVTVDPMRDTPQVLAQ